MYRYLPEQLRNSSGRIKIKLHCNVLMSHSLLYIYVQYNFFKYVIFQNIR